MSKHKHLFSAFIAALALGLVVHAQNYDQSGFISLDCGLPRNSNYTESTTQINYISDADFISTGTGHTIAEEYRNGPQEQGKTLRSFPEGIRNCYNISVTAQTRYLIRATFLHGNYDGQNSVPEFDLHVGGNYWDTVRFVNVSVPSLNEIIHIPRQPYVRICLVNTGSGTPFISALEFRPMSNQVIYNNTGPLDSLALVFRNDMGSNNDFSYRFPQDTIDRLWTPDLLSRSLIQTSTETIDANSNSTYRPPSAVMSTLESPADANASLDFYWPAPNTFTTYYYYLYFAELQELRANESRAFNIYVNGEVVYTNLVPPYLRTFAIYNPLGLSGSMTYNFSFVKTENSTLPPILNALEAYSVLDLSQSETDQNDVDAINNIKSTYGVSKVNWDGDPCVPRAYLWMGLNCSYDGVDPPRIIALNLSASNLEGGISRHILNLSTIEILDLSNNNLTGSLPDFLSQLPNLRVLNLERNNLSGSVPAGLIEKVNQGDLSLSIGENIHLCESSECAVNTNTNKKNNIVIPIVASAGGFVLLLIIAISAFLFLKKKRKRRESKPLHEPFESVKRQYTFAEVKKITNNFERVLGKGGFGEVYHGFIDENTQVAVKMLSSSSRQGYQQFEAEVKLLLKVYHGNLTNLVGYCYEEPNMALIYEYMANGDLSSYLSGDRNNNLLSWEGRLQIALDAAQGLEYLHSGCKPPIIHRDIKPANILLTENFRAKLADFGLSKSFLTDSGGHVSTIVAGTIGYLDPKYKETGWLNEKSDVYSFGVVLLEMITRRTVILSNRNDPNERIHISKWIGSIISTGIITGIVDAALQGDFDTNSVWKAVELGMACASAVPERRPNMSEVVSELKECLALEKARKSLSRATNSTPDSYEVLSNAASEFRPLAR